MSTYQELRGLKVKYLAANPDPGTEGDVWYDSATYELKGFVGRAAWSSVASMNTARAYLAGITGTAGQTAGLIFGGNSSSPGLNETTATEEYDGSGWAVGGVMGTARIGLAGLGIQTAAVAMGGRIPGAKQVVTTEEYNGTAWTAGGDLGTARRYLSGAGTLTSGLAFAGTVDGAPGAGTLQDATEEYDGSSWTDGGALNTARQRGAGTGASQTAAIFFGGSPTPAGTETYDGSSWTSQPAMNSGTSSQAGFGTSTSAISAGGESYRTSVEEWDGSSWAVNPATIAVGNQAMVGGGSSTAGLVMGGWRPAPMGDTTQEYNNTFEVVTQGAWASGNNANTARYVLAGSGIQTAALAFGGFTYPTPGPTAVVNRAYTEAYDGTSWTEVADLGNARQGLGGTGTSTATIAFGGGSSSVQTETFDGSSWTDGGNLNSGRQIVGCGTTTATLAFGDGGIGGETEEYNGTAWSEQNDLNTARAGAGGAGTQTAGLIFGGNKAPSVTLSADSEEYDGTSWTAGGNLNTARRDEVTGGGIQTDALAFGGNTTTDAGKPTSASTEGYDGTAWATRPSMSAGKRSLASANSAPSTAALGSHGYTTAQSLTTEEFTGDTTAETGSTIDFD